MLLSSFQGGRQHFRVVKRAEKTTKANLYDNQRRVLEKGAIVSLLILILLFHIFPKVKERSKNADQLSLSLEVVDIPLIKNEEPPPPPPMEEIITNYTIIEKKEEFDPRKLRELEKVELDLMAESDNSLLANSQIDDITYAGFSRPIARSQRGVSLDIGSDLNIVTNRGAGLELGTVENQSRKKLVDSTPDLDSPALTAAPEQKAEAKKIDTELIKINENQFLLQESESTIGTDEYRLWNKINAALDRLDKNRYGKLPTNIQRIPNGLAALFNYDNGVKHEIFWSKGGKVIIRVTGNRPRYIRDELERAFDSLIRLTL